MIVLVSLRIIVHGIDHAFRREFGCDCDRCNKNESERTNTSVSLAVLDENASVLWHCLVDVGLGVVDDLCKNFSPSQARVDLLLLTHWHPDHVLNLNSIRES